MNIGTVHYEGTLAETGEVFDTTHEDNTIFSFEVGSGSVIKAWDIALKTMKVTIPLIQLTRYNSPLILIPLLLSCRLVRSQGLLVSQSMHMAAPVPHLISPQSKILLLCSLILCNGKL